MQVRNQSRFKHHPLRGAVLLALAACVPVAAIAQESESPPTSETTDLDKVTVTGSRIQRVGFVTSSPVMAITAEEIRALGATNIGDLMARMPQLTPTYTLGNSTRFIGTAGLGLLDLRGMGTSRTLVLVNGRRHVGSSPGSTAVDTNTIPVEWIERVEVITGGASAVYGADAVAGVVNFIMKKSFDGFELRGQHGAAEEGSFNRSFVSFSAGRNFADDRGSAAFSLEYSKQDRFGRGDRKIGREYLITVPNPNYDPSRPPTQDNPQNLYQGPGGLHSLSNGGTFTLGRFDFRDPATYGNRYLFNPDGTFRPNRYDGVVTSNSSCVDCDFLDLDAVANLQPAFDRTGFNTVINFDLNDAHRLFFEGKYSKTESHYLGQSSFDQPIRIRRQNPLVSAELGALMDQHGVSLLSLNRFNLDAGRRGEEVDRQTVRAVFGVEGFLGKDWTYEASVNFGQTTIDRVNLNNRINERWQAGLDVARDGNGNLVCRTTLDPSAINPHTGAVYSPLARTGCVPFSVFGHGAVSQEAANWFNTNSLNSSKLEQRVFTASVANSNLFTLPAGDVGFAGGVEYRKETSRENTDPLSALGLTFLNAIPSQGGEYAVKEVFAETTVPLLADLPGVERLALDLAGRYSDYSNMGSTTTWNVGIDWTVLPSLRFRATKARAVRVPSIGELYSGQMENYAFIADPCNYNQVNSNRPDTAKDPALRRANCSALGIPVGWVDSFSATRPGISGGNPKLQPETAESLSLGFVWQPEFLEGFGMSVDYWRVTLEDAIGRVTGQTNATRCVDSPSGIDNKFCSFITRAPVGGYTDAKGNDFPAHSITSWTGINENMAKSRREGIDVEMDYRFGLFEGDAVVRFTGTRMLQHREWSFQDFPDEFEEYVDSITSPRWRANLQAKYNRGNWRGSWDVNFVHRNLRVRPSSYESNPGSARPIRNASHAVHNMQVGYRFAKTDVSTYLGIDNVFNRNPPLNYFGSGTGSALYDSIGRLLYVGATYRF